MLFGVAPGLFAVGETVVYISFLQSNLPYAKRKIDNTGNKIDYPSKVSEDNPNYPPEIKNYLPDRVIFPRYIIHLYKSTFHITVVKQKKSICETNGIQL